MSTTLYDKTQIDMQSELDLLNRDEMLANYWNYLRDGVFCVSKEQRSIKSNISRMESKMYELQQIENEHIGKKKRRMKKLNWCENKVTITDKRIHELQTKLEEYKAKVESKNVHQQLGKRLTQTNDDVSELVFGKVNKT